MPQSFRAMAELFHARGEPVLSAQLAGSVHCVSYAPGRVDIRPQAGADPRLPAQIAAHLIRWRSEEHTSELQSLMRISYAVFCLKKKNKHKTPQPSAQYIKRISDKTK